MKRDSIKYVLVGAVVSAAIVLLLVGLALITGRSGASTDYFVHYRNVTGLRYGAPVFYEVTESVTWVRSRQSAMPMARATR